MRRDAGRLDWAAVAALAASVTTVVAIVTAVMIFSQARQDAQHVRFNATLESLWRLVDQWNSADMTTARSGAATALLADQPNHDVDDVLDFFDEISFLLSRGALDEEMVWYEFYRPMANYWFASQDHVRQVQRNDPTTWEQIGRTVTRLVAIEARRRSRTSDDLVPSRAQIREFLTAEIGNAECEEETEARRMPL